MFDLLSRRHLEVLLLTYENLQNAEQDNSEQVEEKCATNWEWSIKSST